MAFLEDEPGAGKVEKALREVLSGKAEGFQSVINWGEIYHTVMREQGEEVAREVVELLGNYPVKLFAADQDLTKKAARFKGRFKIAYADCFAAALGLQYKATVLTGDPEFKELEKEVKIAWLS